MYRTISILAAGATVVAVAGCGGTNTLTKAQVIKQGSAICRAAERKVERLQAPRSQNPFAKDAPKGDRRRAVTFLAGYANALDGARRGLAQLHPPRQGKQQLESFISQLGPTVARFRRAHDEAAADDGRAAMADAQAAFGMFAKASAETKAYGFPRGVCQSGSSG